MAAAFIPELRRRTSALSSVGGVVVSIQSRSATRQTVAEFQSGLLEQLSRYLSIESTERMEPVEATPADTCT